MEQLPSLLLKGHLCVSQAYPHPHIHLFYALVGKAVPLNLEKECDLFIRAGFEGLQS